MPLDEPTIGYDNIPLQEEAIQEVLSIAQQRATALLQLRQALLAGDTEWALQLGRYLCGIEEV